MSGVTIKNVSKSFGAFTVLEDIDLRIEDGEFIVLVGPSGCGKTTLLRMIAGLESVTDGRIHLKGQDITWLAPRDRDIAMVFQSYALYPHMTVAENIGFCLKLRKLPKSEIADRVVSAAEALKIGHLLGRRPRELSGGQRQRVAMGRAIVREPALYLFDEPLSNLDAQLRTRMRTEIKRMHQEDRTTVVYVTHDQVEAMTLADRIVVMNGGKIEQIGTPDELYNKPASIFVGSFIGSPSMNLLPGRLALDDAGLAAIVPGGRLPLPGRAARKLADRVGDEIVVGIRPERISLAANGGSVLDFTVTVVEPYGAEAYVVGDSRGVEIIVRCAADRLPKPGDHVPLSVDPSRMHVFDARGEANLLQQEQDNVQSSNLL